MKLSIIRQNSISLKELKQLAIIGGKSLDNVLSRFSKETALTTIAIEEVTLNDFVESGTMTILKGSEIISMHRIGRLIDIVKSCV